MGSPMGTAMRLPLADAAARPTRLVAGSAISTSWSQRKTPMQVHVLKAVSTAIRFATLYSEQVGLFPNAASGAQQRSHVRSLASRSQGSTRRAILPRTAPAGQRPQYQFIFARHAHNARWDPTAFPCEVVGQSVAGLHKKSIPASCRTCWPAVATLSLHSVRTMQVVASRMTISPSDHERLRF